jgi:hypothetical protein
MQKEHLINLLKNQIWDREEDRDGRPTRYIILEGRKIKRKIGELNNHKYVISWVIRDSLENPCNETELTMIVDSSDDKRTLLHGLIVSVILLDNNSNLFLPLY